MVNRGQDHSNPRDVRSIIILTDLASGVWCFLTLVRWDVTASMQVAGAAGWIGDGSGRRSGMPHDRPTGGGTCEGWASWVSPSALAAAAPDTDRCVFSEEANSEGSRCIFNDLGADRGRPNGADGGSALRLGHYPDGGGDREGVSLRLIRYLSDVKN
jgi:hypothetical protein